MVDNWKKIRAHLKHLLQYGVLLFDSVAFVLSQ